MQMRYVLLCYYNLLLRIKLVNCVCCIAVSIDSSSMQLRPLHQLMSHADTTNLQVAVMNISEVKVFKTCRVEIMLKLVGVMRNNWHCSICYHIH